MAKSKWSIVELLKDESHVTLLMISRHKSITGANVASDLCHNVASLVHSELSLVVTRSLTWINVKQRSDIYIRSEYIMRISCRMGELWAFNFEYTPENYRVITVPRCITTQHFLVVTFCDVRFLQNAASYQTWSESIGIILGMGPASEGRRYTVTSSLIGWAHTKTACLTKTSCI